MLPRNLSNLRFRDATLSANVEKIQRWILSHPRASFIDPEVLVRDCEIRPADLSRALMELVSLNVLRVRYKAMSPHTRSLTDKDFDSPFDIDEELYDAGENQFRKEDAEIIPVFVGV
jgi:hypothetical protein